MLSSFEVIYSSLQTGFLAFAVYLSAIILKTLLPGKSLLWFWFNHTQSECHEANECIDGGGIDDEGDPDKIVSIVLQVPRILPTTSPTTSVSSVIDSLLEPIDEVVDNMLFTSSKFISLNNSVQECVEVSSSMHACL